MLAKDGNSMTVPYAKVGELTKQIYEMLRPLQEGPFGGEDNPPHKALKEIKMQIMTDVVTIEEFDCIDDFIEAIDKLPNPAVSSVENVSANEGMVSFGEVRQAMNDLFDYVEKLDKTVEKIEHRLIVLVKEVRDMKSHRREVDEGHGHSRSLPW